MIPDYEYPRQNGPTLILEAFLSSPLLSLLEPGPHCVLKQMYVNSCKKNTFFVNLNFWYNKPFFNIQKVLYIQVSPGSPSSPGSPLGSPWFPPGFE